MSKPRIAIDIDDVLAASAPAFVAYSNERWGLDLTIDDYDEHWGRMWRIEHDREETLRRAEEVHASGLAGRHQPFEEALPVLQQLSLRYELVVVTSRRLSIKPETDAWLGQYFEGIFSEVHFAGIWDNPLPGRITATKTEVCRQIGADYLVDDQLKHCLSAAEAGIPAVLFGDYPWNNMSELPTNVTRCEDWAEVQAHFDRVTL